MQGNRRNGREESDIVAISEPYTPLRKKQRLRNCILKVLQIFSLRQCLNFFSYKAILIVNVIKRTKIDFSDKIFTSIAITIANVKDMDRLCLNAQCSLITATTRPTPYFYYFIDDEIFCHC